MFIINAFSASMITLPARVEFEEITLQEARILAGGAISAVGHKDTAELFTALLGTPVPCQRVSVSLKEGSPALLGQLSGPDGPVRLPEGSTTLPKGSKITWIFVYVA